MNYCFPSTPISFPLTNTSVSTALLKESILLLISPSLLNCSVTFPQLGKLNILKCKNIN